MQLCQPCSKPSLPCAAARLSLTWISPALHLHLGLGQGSWPQAASASPAGCPVRLLACHNLALHAAGAGLRLTSPCQAGLVSAPAFRFSVTSTARSGFPADDSSHIRGMLLTVSDGAPWHAETLLGPNQPQAQLPPGAEAEKATSPMSLAASAGAEPLQSPPVLPHHLPVPPSTVAVQYVAFAPPGHSLAQSPNQTSGFIHPFPGCSETAETGRGENSSGGRARQRSHCLGTSGTCAALGNTEGQVSPWWFGCQHWLAQPHRCAG